MWISLPLPQPHPSLANPGGTAGMPLYALGRYKFEEKKAFFDMLVDTDRGMVTEDCRVETPKVSDPAPPSLANGFGVVHIRWGVYQFDQTRTKARVGRVILPLLPPAGAFPVP